MFFFRVQSQIAVWSLKRMRHLCIRKADGIYRSCRREKLRTDSTISGAMKSYTNEHTVRGRPTLKDIKCFLKGSVRGLYERSIYERTFLGESIENHVRCILNELSDVNHVFPRANSIRRSKELSTVCPPLQSSPASFQITEICFREVLRKYAR